MGKMITHEEARSYLLNILQSKTNEEVNKNELLLLKYFTQQEKIGKLLELYRIKDEVIEMYNVADSTLERQQALSAIQAIREEIAQLESELGL